MAMNFYLGTVGRGASAALLGLMMACRTDAEVLFTQPALSGVTDNLYVLTRPPVGSWSLLALQTNPYSKNGKFVPSNWPAGDKTGFFGSQEAFRDQLDSTTAQAQGDVVGAYLNSADLIHGSKGSKLMITPQVQFASPVRPYASAQAMGLTLQLQVPSASGKEAYVSSDLEFADIVSGALITYTAALFQYNSALKGTCVLGYDGPTGSHTVTCPLLPGVQFLTATLGTERAAPWAGFKTFGYSVTKDQFAAALKAFNIPGASLNPADYQLMAFHLNAELHYMELSTLGWSMKGVQITAQ
jgi:hypothetical protein